LPVASTIASKPAIGDSCGGFAAAGSEGATPGCGRAEASDAVRFAPSGQTSPGGAGAAAAGAGDLGDAFLAGLGAGPGAAVAAAFAAALPAGALLAAALPPVTLPAAALRAGALPSPPSPVDPPALRVAMRRSPRLSPVH
jgi:hypothetical protein